MNTPKTVKLRLVRKSETNEWLVKVWINGVHAEGPTYYTDDKDDAKNTMALMAKQYAALGCSLV